MIPVGLNKNFVTCLSALCVMGLMSSAYAVSTVPPGFEDIMMGQDEHINVFFLGKPLGLFQVFVTPEAVRFVNPERLLQAIQSHVNPSVDVSKVGNSLSVAMARNGNLACFGQVTLNGCGYVETDSAAVIYDESEGKIDLFLSGDWVKKEERSQRFRQISSMTENALIQQQTINLSGGEGYKSLSVSGTGALGITPTSFVGGNWSLTHLDYSRKSDSQFLLQDFYYRHDLGTEHYVQAGRMDNRNLASPIGGNFGFTMLPIGRIDGFRVGTTLAYVNHENAQQGTPVTLLLPRDSRIDVYRGQELLGTFYMKAGVNTIDTSRFPEGTYLLTLRVFENGVQARTQTAPFTKTGGGANLQTRQWFVQSGRLSGWGARDGAVTAAGIRIPLTQASSLTSGIASIGRHFYNETAIEWRHAFSRGVLSAGGSFFAGNDGAHGNNQQISFADGMSWSLYRYQMRGASCSAASAPYGDIGCYDMLNASVSFPFRNWSAMLGYSYNKRVGQSHYPLGGLAERPWATATPYYGSEVSRALQISLSRSLTLRNINSNLRIGAYANRNAGARNDYGAYVGVTLSMATPAAPNRREGTYTSAGFDLRTDQSSTRKNYTLDRSWNWQGDGYRELALGLSGDGTESLTGTLQGRWQGRYGDVFGAISNSYSRGNGGNNPSVTASYSSSMAISRQGMYFGVAGLQSDPLAGFAVNVAKRDGASGMAAEVGSSSSSKVKIGFGQRVLLPVSAFTPVVTEVSDAGAQTSVGTTSVTQGLGKRKLFMVPGQLVLHNVDAKITYTYVGQAFSEAGTPLSNSVILNGSIPPLDRNGGFVAEMNQKENELFIVDGRKVMRCPLHIKRQQDVLMIVGKVICKETQPDALPNELRKQVRVQKLLQKRLAMSIRSHKSGLIDASH